MKVNNINNNYSNYKINTNQNNNNPNFKALKGVKYELDFNPKVYLEHAEAVLAFKKSEPLNKLFKKHDGFAIFSANGEKDAPKLKIFYNSNSAEKTVKKDIEPKNKGFFKKISNKIKNFLLEDEVEPKVVKPSPETTLKQPIEHFEINSNNSSITEYSPNFLTKAISKLTDADIQKELEKNTAKAIEKEQRAERLKQVHQEIKDLL